MNVGTQIVSPLTTHAAQVGFATLVLPGCAPWCSGSASSPRPPATSSTRRSCSASRWPRGRPSTPSASTSSWGSSTGQSGVTVWKDAEAKIVGKTVDLVLRAIARPDQARVCASRVADVMLALHELDFAEPRMAVEQERQHLMRLAQAVGAQQGPIGHWVLTASPSTGAAPSRRRRPPRWGRAVRVLRRGGVAVPRPRVAGPVRRRDPQGRTRPADDAVGSRRGLVGAAGARAVNTARRPFARCSRAGRTGRCCTRARRPTPRSGSPTSRLAPARIRSPEARRRRC